MIKQEHNNNVPLPTRQYIAQNTQADVVGGDAGNGGPPEGRWAHASS